MQAEDRRRVLLVGLLWGPLALWGGLDTILRLVLQRKTAAELSSWGQVAYGLHSALTFFLPVAVITVFFGSPVVTTAIAAVAGVGQTGQRSSYEDEWKSLWTWLAVSVVAFVVGAILHRTPVELGLIAVSTPTLWLGVVSYAIAMGVAYSLLKILHAEGRLGIAPGWVFVVVFVTPCLAGLPAVALVVWLYLSRKPLSAMRERRLTRR